MSRFCSAFLNPPLDAIRMNTNQLIILLFGVAYFAYILYTRRRTNFEEYTVASRSMGSFFLFASISASYIGPASTLGISREAFNTGWFLLWVAPASGFALIVIGYVVAPVVRQRFSDSYSIGDIVGGPKSHNHWGVRLSVGVASVLLMSAIGIVMSYAGGELINNVFGFSKVWSITIMTTIVVLYATFGGIRATIQTDAFQFITFAILLPLLAILLILDPAFSWEGYVQATRPRALPVMNNLSVSAYVGMFLFWLFSNAGLEAPFFNRYLAARNASVARRATVFSGIFSIVWLSLMVFIGSVAYYLYPTLADNDQILLRTAAANFPNALYGIFIVGMIGVVMSTQDTVLNSVGVVFSEDILSPLTPGLTNQQKLLASKLSTSFAGVMAIGIAGFLTSALGAIIAIFSFYAPVMIPVLLFSVLKRRHYWPAAVCSMVAGFLVSFLFNFIISSSVPSILIGLASSTLIYLIVDYWMHTKIKSSLRTSESLHV